ncbi:hypothetical protein D3C87_347890 [compost metagenome]
MSQEELLKEVNVLLRYEGLDVAESLDEALEFLAEIDVNLEARAERARSMASTIRSRLEAIKYGDED